jgi:pyruvate decarboxylase
MGFLDSIEDHETLKWVGNCNELNAAYSADGYARTPRRNPQNKTIPGRGKVAALVTTFGVGDLSCLNGIAGSFAERVPVVHIVGVPSTSLQGKGALLHHTLGNGSFDVFKEMSKHIVIASAILGEFVDDPVYACKMIDRTLTKGFREARPVYITLPMDMVDLAAPTSNMLGTPLDISPLENDKEAEADCIREILSRIDAAKDPIIILDACAIRHDVLAESHELVEKSGFSVFSTPMGKSAMDEGHSQFGGIYVGSNTVPEIKERVESADLLIQIGSLLSDFNTANFSYRTPRSATIDFHSDRISVGYATYNNIGMKAVLPKISAHLSSRHKQRLDLTLSTLPKFENILPTREEEIKNGASKEGKDAEDHITQAWLWPRIGMFIEKDDQIIAETGTSSFGSLAIKLPSSSFPNFHSQVLWGSIGWSVGACLGVALAAREEKLGRVILFVGDGSFQLSEYQFVI